MNAFSAGKRHIYDAVSMIHKVIRTAKPFPYILLNSGLSLLEIVKPNKSDVER